MPEQEGSIVVDKIRSSKKGTGYDAEKGEYADMIVKQEGFTAE